MPHSPRLDRPKLNSEWLNAEEAAEYLRLRNVRALYDHVRRGRVPAHRLPGGRLLRFHRLELDAVLGRCS
jgi:excisionase family DNA binding protein